MTPQDLDRAIQGLLDGTLPHEEHVSLKRVLENDPEALNTYLDYIDLHMILGARAGSRRETSLIPKLVESTIDHQRRKALMISAMATAAAFVIVAVILHFTVVPNSPPVISFQTSSDTHFEVSHQVGNDEEIKPETLNVGSRIRLSQGCVEFSFSSGVRAVIQAPADLTVHQENRLYLAEGQAWFHVPESAVGFQVATHDVLVTDLGTEFAIVSTEDASDEVHVLSGRVHSINQNGLKEEETLSAGQARVFGPSGRMKSIPVRSSGFLTFLPDSLPHLHWSFDGETPLQVKGTLPSFPAITTQAIQSDQRPESERLVSGKHGRALAFDGHGDRVQTDWQGFLGRIPRTLACWIKVFPDDPEGWGSIAEWGFDQGRTNSYWRVRVTPGEGSSTQGVLRLGYGINWIDGETDVADGNWHHIVIVESEASDSFGFPLVRFFVDGREENLTYLPRTKAAAPIETRAGENLSMGRPLPGETFFRGEIDELFIFEGTLSQTSIYRLMSTHKP